MPIIERPWISIEEQEEDKIFLDLIRDVNYNVQDEDVDSDIDIFECFDCFD